MSDTQPQLEPSTFVIFGITGDLSQRKLLPALYHLVKDNLLHDHTEIVGVSRRDVSTDELLETARQYIKDEEDGLNPEVFEKLRQMITMVHMDITAGAAYDDLRTKLQEIEDRHGLCMNLLFYLSIPPQVYGPIIRLLGEHGLNHGCQHSKAESRLLVEKPFGYDMRSAIELIETTKAAFKEEQIFRIDHYVAKETAQNVITFRQNNPIFRALWSKQHITAIEISAKEAINIEGRVAFYEQIGALRDLIQSHLLNLLALVMMDLPPSMTAESFHESRLKALHEVNPIAANEVSERAVRAQYDGYTEEVSKPDSVTETFASIWLTLGGESWSDVPVLIRTGKALDAKVTEIVVVFRHDETADNTVNILRFRIQPNEGISLSVRVKKPGYDNQTELTTMDFDYHSAFNTDGHPDAYERVLVDAVRGDQTLFTTSEEVLAAWRIVEPVVEQWSQSSNGMEHYPQGAIGPTANVELAERAGQMWF